MKYFFDTEFIERGPDHPIKFLSLGMVSEDGRELYVQSPWAEMIIIEDYERYGDPWLKDNVLPHLIPHDPKNAFTFAPREIIKSFIGSDTNPEFWAYFADYDWVVFCQLFGRMIDLPKGWPMHCLDLKQEMHRFGIHRDAPFLPINKFEHSALADARWVQDVFRIMQFQLRGTVRGFYQ